MFRLILVDFLKGHFIRENERVVIDFFVIGNLFGYILITELLEQKK